MFYMINGNAVSYSDFCKSLARDTMVFDDGQANAQLSKQEYLSAMSALDSGEPIRAGQEHCASNLYQIVR